MFSASQMNKFKLSRRGRKLQVSDDSRTLVALPKDVPERTWAEILQKEENDLLIFEIREEIVEEAIRIGYEMYMDKQNAIFTAYCAAEAWLKLIDWQFYRHDPGEEPSSYPPCHIPHREESWTPDELPEPSPRDSWCKQTLRVVEDSSEDVLQTWPSCESLDVPLVEEIPREYWFPGKVLMKGEEYRRHEDDSIDYNDSYESESRSDDLLAAESELLQRVTDYSSTELTKKESVCSALKTTSPAEGSLQGGGDGPRIKLRRNTDTRSKIFSRQSIRSRVGLVPIGGDSRSRISVISDCRLRNLRLDTQYEVTSEKVDTPPGEPLKRK